MSVCVEPNPTAIGRRRPVRGQARRANPIAPGGADEEALVEQHLPLVKNVVGRLGLPLPPPESMDDLNGSGLMGLLSAVRNFDPHGGSSFVSYARVRIRGAILDELRRLDWVPRSVHDKARNVQAVMQQLEQQKG